jgi:O-antigen/teichoic acid export membrane protein
MNFLRKNLDTQSKTLLKNSSWVFFSNFIGAGLAFLRGIVIARGLGAELFGIYTLIVAFIITVQKVLDLNLGSAVIRYGSQFRAENNRDKIVSLLKISLNASSVMALISILVITILTLFSYSTFIKAPGMEWFAITYAIASASLFYNQISKSSLRLYFKFRLNSIIQIIMDITEFILVLVALFFFPKDLYIFMTAILISKFINGLIPNIAAWRELRPEFQHHLKASTKLISDQLKAIRKFVISNSIAKTLQSLINTGDVLIIGLISNPLQTVYYAVGKRLAFSILTITDPMVTSIYPQLCKLYEDHNIKAMRLMLLKLTMLAAIPAALFATGAFFLNEWIMVFVFGSEYLPAGQTFYLLTWASLIYATFFWIQPLLQTLNIMNVRLKIYAVGIVTEIIIASILVPKQGSTGMAIAVISTGIIMSGMFLYFAFKKLNELNSANISQSKQES